jgi:hypothetical protein
MGNISIIMQAIITIRFIVIFQPVFSNLQRYNFFLIFALSSRGICFFALAKHQIVAFMSSKIALKINNVFFSVLFREIVVPLQIGIEHIINQQ